MLNGRLYLQAWLIATLALFVAFLTLRSPEPTPDATPPVQFAGTQTSDLAERFREAAPLRVPGTVGAAAGEKWITDQFKTIPGGERLVSVQRAVIRRDGQDIPIANVVFTSPARAETTIQRRILVVAPRDAPRQVSGGTSSTAILAELARLSVRQRYHHPLIFVSVDADTLGNAGFRWYLAHEVRSRIAGVIVLDAPGEGVDTVPVIDSKTGGQARDPSSDRPLTKPASDASTIYLWSSGAGRQSLDIRRLAERAVAAAGFTASPLPPLRRQLLGLSFTETRGAQRAAIDLGIPAVTLSARRESPLPVDTPRISPTRVRAAGTAALTLIGLLDGRDRARVPDRALVYAGRTLRPSVSRLALLLLALPVFVLALDAISRVRRSRVRLAGGLHNVALRAVPVAVALLLGWLLTLMGIFRSAEVGRPVAPADLPFDGQATLAVLLVALSAIASVMVLRPRWNHGADADLGDLAAALLVLSVALLVAWWHTPFSLVILLPVVHTVIGAAIVPRLWQALALMVGSLLTPLAVLVRVSGIVDRGLPYGLWYIVQTTLSGARGLLGPVVVGAVIAALGVVMALVIGRIRDGAVHPLEGRKGLAVLASNLSARKRTGGAEDGPAAPAERRRPITSRNPRRR